MQYPRTQSHPFLLCALPRSQACTQPSTASLPCSLFRTRRLTELLFERYLSEQRVGVNEKIGVPFLVNIPSGQRVSQIPSPQATALFQGTHLHNCGLECKL